VRLAIKPTAPVCTDCKLNYIYQQASIPTPYTGVDGYGALTVQHLTVTLLINAHRATTSPLGNDV
jgi:hypothetical protein